MFLRRAARISLRRLAREIDIDVRLLAAVEKGKILLTPEIVEAVKPVLRRLGVSDTSLSLLDFADMASAAMDAPESSFADYSRSDLARIEGLLSEISSKLSSLVSGVPGSDLKALISRVETANGHLNQIARNTQK